MFDLADHRRRASPEAVVERRRLRTVAAPLTKNMSIWHARAAHLAGKIDHALQHGEPLDDVANSVDLLTAEVCNRFSAWRTEVVRECVGVLDVERSCRSMIGRLQVMRSQIAMSQRKLSDHQ